ncbi:MAG: SPFH domain-containing protein [Lachnospiraceae bacterium]|nr:SPFH domain-containing protein [Lachnospiraceae bacterium]
MGLLKAAKDSIGSLLADQWREYFYCDSLSSDVLVTKGKPRYTEGRNSNTKGTDNIISNGSIIAVNEGQCMLIVEQGAIVDLCAEAGEFVYDQSTEPTLLYGNFGENVKKSFSTFGRRFTFGGNTAKDQRVYFVNTKEIMNNLYGTATPIPFRIVDARSNLDMDTNVKCNGNYSFKIADPVIFYTKICSNVTDSYTRDKLTAQMKGELLTAMQPALEVLAAKGIRPYELAGHTLELVEVLKGQLSEQWGEMRGIEMVSMTISADIPEKDRETLNKWQQTAILQNPGMAAARQTEAYTAALENMKTGGADGKGSSAMEGAMTMMAMGMMQNMANGGGMMPGMGMQQGTGAQQGMQSNGAVLGWTCSCGKADNRGKFCENCGTPKPAEAGWTCSCGHVNQGKFCQDCGTPKPTGAPLYKCDKCGWEPEDPAHPPKFCPECGDVFDENDIR